MHQNDISRTSMVKSQLLTAKVLDAAVIEAFLSVPRESFAPETLRNAAYVDEELYIAPGRFLLEPKTLGKLLEVANIQTTDTVLVVAAASGYSCAIISKLAARVVALEEIRDLSEKSKLLFKTNNIQNVEVVNAPLDAGYPSLAPYQVIFIEGAVQNIGAALFDQLAEGGKIITVENISTKVNDATGLGKAVSYTKVNNTLFKKVHFDASVPNLRAFEHNKGFVF